LAYYSKSSQLIKPFLIVNKNNMLSKNAVGIVVLLLSFAGVNVADSQVEEVITAIGTIYGFIMLLWHQVMDRQDVHNFFFKK
jgi:hypothetical protein